MDVPAFRSFLVALSDELHNREQANEGEPIDRNALLAEIFLEYLEDEGITQEATMCPHRDDRGRRRCAITAVSVAESEARADLFLAEYRQPKDGVPETISTSDLADLAGRAARFFDYAIKEDWPRFSESPECLDAARRLRSVHSELSTVRVFILTNALARDRDVDAIEVAGHSMTFEVIDVARLFRLAGELTSRADIDIDFTSLIGRPLPCLEMTPRAPDYDTYLVIFPGQLVSDLYAKYGQRLFEFNVRSFLQAKGKVNKGIRDTLRDSPDRFMAYNNGLVATADEVEVHLQDGAHVISRIQGLQIVNGAQTTASIYRARTIDRMQLDKVSVAVKLTRVAAGKLQEFVPLISRFANTQNVIQVADLSANNDFHIALERLSEQIWCPGEKTRWFYERARGSYEQALQREGTTAARKGAFKEATPPTMRITKTDLARYLIGWLGRPHTVSLGAQKNFSVFMAELPDLFPDSWKPDDDFYRGCVSKAILYRACERAVRMEKFAAYRVNVAAYLFSVLAHVSAGEADLDLIWNGQSVSDALFGILRKWSGVVDDAIRASAGAKNVTEWCKKSDCWDAVRAAQLNVDTPIPELSLARSREARQAEVVPEPASSVSMTDEDSIEECMRYDAAAWAKLNFWGVSTDALDYYERGVAHTLSEYAASDWSRRPSVKQARIGARVLRRARDEQLIS